MATEQAVFLCERRGQERSGAEKAGEERARPEPATVGRAGDKSLYGGLPLRLN